jgi:hypothetical protein
MRVHAWRVTGWMQAACVGVAPIAGHQPDPDMRWRIARRGGVAEGGALQTVQAIITQRGGAWDASSKPVAGRL